jgi:hypothetical protein
MAKSTKTEDGPVHKFTPATTVKSLATAFDQMQTKSQRARGDYGEQVAEAVEKKHLHKRAWAAVQKERKMEPGELNEFYAHQDYYREKLGLLELAESAPPLDLEDEDDDNVVEMREAAE